MTTVDNFAVAGPPAPRHRAVDPDERHRSGGPSSSSRASQAPGQSEAATPRPRVRDKVDVSPKVEVFSNAFEVACQTPSIRTALVAEMRDLVATGRIGQDVHRLATKLIDSIDDLATRQMRARKPASPRLVPGR